MISHLLDTDKLTLYQRGHSKVTAQCTAAPAGSLAITIVSVEEQFLGWHTAARQAQTDEKVSLAYDSMSEFANFIKRLPIVSLGEKAIQRYRQLQALKLNVPKKDLRIAAIALEIGAIVVTANRSDFGRVPGLTIEDWSK
jgi:tRNA(fMet)-specific endonuclease VapC